MFKQLHGALECLKSSASKRLSQILSTKLYKVFYNDHRALSYCLYLFILDCKLIVNGL